MYLDEIDSYLKSLEELSSKIDSSFESSRKELSKYDSELCDIYHYIEFGKYDAIEGWRILKILKDTLKKRRDAKDALAIKDSINSSLKTYIKKASDSYEKYKLSVTGERKYNYRTKVIKKAVKPVKDKSL